MSKSKIFLLGSLIFLVANFIWLLYFDKQEKNSYFVFDKFYTFEALVKNTDKKLNGYNILIEPQNLDNFSGNILVYTYLYPEYHYNDNLEISCKIYQPEPIVSENGKVFAYNKYLAKDNIFATCFRPRIKILGQTKNLAFYILKAKDYAWKNLNDYLVEPSSSLAKGMFLAARREIPSDLRDVFARVGLSHMIAISGLHIAIIVWLMQSFLIALGLSRKSSLWFLIIFLAIYLYMIGFPSSAVRASLMVVILLLGPFLGRSTESIYSLVLVADVFILFNPYLLLYDIGFQLSFLAVTGLLYYVKFFNKILVFIPKQFKIREVMSVTLAAQVFTWPLIIYNFGIFSLIAPIANFLILPFLPLVLILSIILAIVGFWSVLANLIAWPLFIILKIIVYIANLLVKIPYSFFVIESFSLLYMFLALFFMIMITLVLKPKDYE